MRPVPVLFAIVLASVGPTARVVAEPLRVFILAGQSNMQGHAQVRTFARLGMDPGLLPLLNMMQQPDGSPTVCERVWISSLGSADQERVGRLTAGFGAAGDQPKIGPEFTFGLTMQTFTDAPILLIKTAWGGTSLHTDFRPPSAGPFVFGEAQLATIRQQGKDPAEIQAAKAAETGVFYRLMLEHVRMVLADIARVVPDYDAAAGYELSGFVWFQGWNDMVDSGVYPDRDQPGGYDAYRDCLVHFIRDVRRDLGAPGLPFVIGVLGVGGPTAEYGPEEQRYRATHQNFRDAMAAPARLPEFDGNVAAVLTETYWDREVSQAKAKEEALRRQMTADGRTPAEQQAAFEALRAEQLTDRERRLLECGMSNQEYHYLGSARILGGIGQGFAEAMADLVGWRRRVR